MFVGKQIRCSQIERAKETESRPQMQSTVASKPGPGLAREMRATSGSNWPANAGHIRQGGLAREMQSISRLTTGGGAGGRLVKKEQGKVPWSTPILEPVPGDYDRATLANADIF